MKTTRIGNPSFFIPRHTEPLEERRRLAALRRYSSVNTFSELAFDRVSAAARRRWQTRIALIGFVDDVSVLLKSLLGIKLDRIPRRGSFFDSTILSREITVVEDALSDTRFADHAFTQNQRIRFYAGAPIRVGGFNLGALCILDDRRHSFGADDRKELAEMASVVADETETPGYQAFAATLGVSLFELRPTLGGSNT